MVLLNLFFSFLRIGLFSIGGAYSFLPLIEKEIVQKYNWLTKEEFLDVLGMSRVLPGAISIKYATYTGYKIAGILGAFAANLGNIFAPVILILFFSSLYLKYRDLPQLKRAFGAVQLVLFSMLVALAFQLIKVNQLMHFKSLLIIIVSFFLFVYTKVHPALIIIGAGLLGIALK